MTSDGNKWRPNMDSDPRTSKFLDEFDNRWDKFCQRHYEMGGAATVQLRDAAISLAEAETDDYKKEIYIAAAMAMECVAAHAATAIRP